MIRLPAEWEPQEVLLFALPHENTDWAPYLDEILTSYKTLIQTAAQFQACLVLCADVDAAEKWYGEANNVTFVQIPTDDTWIRDFGPIDVQIDGRFVAHDFIFNAWGDKFGASNDNLANRALYDQGILQGLRKQIDMVLEGGSIESNGEGVMLTTTACLLNENRNPELSQMTIENSLKELFGLTKVLWLNNGHLRGDDTDAHIDTLARFITKDTIAYVSCDDKDDEHYAPLRAMEEELEKTGYTLLPMPLPKAIYYDGVRLPATYANFIFVNGGLIVPTYNQSTDAQVLASLQKALPQLQIVGVDAQIFIRQNGSLHCATINRFKGIR